jgi:recombination protein RecT
MAQKTCIRQLAKYMPKSTELAVALVADEGIRVDLSPTTDAAEATEHPVFEGEVLPPSAVDMDGADPDSDPAVTS